MALRIVIFTILLNLPCYVFGNAPVWQDLTLDSLVKAGNQENILRYLDEKIRQAKNLSPGWRHYYQNMRSKAFYRSEKLEETLAEAKISLELFKTSRDSGLLIDSWRTIAIAYNRLGKLDSSLIFTKLMYDYAKVSGDYQMRRGSMMLLGNIATQNKRYRQAYDFYQEALQESIQKNDPVNLPIDYYNLGLADFFLQRYDQAEAMFNKSLGLSLKKPDLLLLVRIYGSLSDVAEKTGNLEKQRFFLQKSNAVAEKIGDLRMLATGKTVLMRLSLTEKNYAGAIDLGKEAKSYLRRATFPPLEIQVDSMLYVALKAQGNYRQALEYYEAFSKKQREVINEKETQKLNEITARYDLEKKNLLIGNQEAELRSAMRANRVNLLLIALLLSLLLSVAFTYLRERNFRTRLFIKEKAADTQISALRKHIETQKEPDRETLNIVPATASALQPETVEPVQEKSLSLYNRILELILKEKLYLNPELDQKFFVQRLSTNKAYLYDAISTHGDANFKGMINRFRIDEAKTVIKSMVDQKKPIQYESVMHLSGFNSKSTFYRLFKAQTGLTPSEYAEEYEKDRAKQS
jgi:tetratricopeptide (TPR) repeat protein